MRHITADLYQIGECAVGLDGHEAVHAYVLLNNGQPIIIDCGSHLHRAELTAQLDEVLAGQTPAYVFLTHSELPHSGNLEMIAQRWPDIKVIVSNVLLPYIELAPVIPLEQISAAVPGETLSFPGRELKFIDALLKDQPGSQWIYDTATKALFTGDGFGYYHPAGTCHHRHIPIAEPQFRAFHYNAFRFLRWTKPRLINSALDQLQQDHDIAIIAPIHGSAIIRDIPGHISRLQQAIIKISEQWSENSGQWSVVSGQSVAAAPSRATSHQPPSTIHHPATIFGTGIERVAVRPITDNIYWITHCLGDEAVNFYSDYFALLPDADNYAGSRIVDYPFSAFLIKDEKTMLIDTVAPRQRDNMMKALDHILGEDSIDYIYISHIELPHAGNAPTIMRQHPKAKLVTLEGSDHYALHGLDKALMVSPGDTIELGQHTIEVVDPLFVDHGLSLWAYERHTGFFFTADWGHNLHEPSCDQCFQFVDEMEAGGYTAEQYIDDVKVNAWYQFPWLSWTDPNEIAEAVGQLFERYDVRIFAPSHGNIIRQNVPDYVEKLKEGMRQAVKM